MDDPRIRRRAPPAEAMSRDEALATPGVACDLWRIFGSHAERLGYFPPSGAHCGERGLR